MRVAIVHYHFRRGGVTSVVANAVRALEPLGDNCVAICGEPPAVELPCPVRVVAGLGYRADSNVAGLDADALAYALMVAAKDAFDGHEPDLWHIHNPTLGKNLVFPAVLKKLADSGQRILLQIHDFAEDGRPGNYRVAKASGLPMYPTGPGIAYAVLNERDAAYLRKAGGTPLLLPNAVPEPHADSEFHPEKALPRFDRLFLYPTRGIRRKNIGETALFAAVAPQGAGVATTLSPKNPEWIPVHRVWERYSDQRGLPLVLGAAGQGADFASMCQRAEAWLSTSVAEGFGLAFLEPWVQNKALIGRDLPAITTDFVSEGMDLSNLYSRLDVPVDSVDWTAFTERLGGAMIRSRSAYGRDCPASLVEEALSAWVQEGQVDFGALDELAQMQLIESVLKSDALKAELAKKIFKLPEAKALKSNRAVVRARYSQAAYGERLHGIYSDLLSAPTGPADASLDEEAMLDAFLDPDAFRMLRS